MSEILKVLNRKNVELKSEVVELGLLDDIKSEANEAKERVAIVKEDTKAIEKFASIYKGIKAEASSNEKVYKSLFDTVEKFKKAATDLGVKPPKEVGIAERWAQILEAEHKKLMGWVKTF